MKMGGLEGPPKPPALGSAPAKPWRSSIARVVAAVPLAALGLFAGAAPARASSVAALEGSWAVAQASVNAVSRVNRKMLNSTWTFRGAELVVQNAHGEHMRSALSFDAIAQPPAFQITLFTLVPASPAPVLPGPCEILRVAGVDRLLGGPTLARPEQGRASAPGSSCALDRSDSASAVSLTIVASPGGSGYVDGARREAQASRRMQIEDEPALGPGAFFFAQRVLDAL